ncbi:MAG: HAD-IC family P-type ATPase [Alphaproteobacteria bacterium]|nr:HAD-IC family P-type ATPase [Alphaproteobacteria bacterium]
MKKEICRKGSIIGLADDQSMAKGCTRAFHEQGTTMQQSEQLWHALEKEAVCAALQVSDDGLSTTESESRLSKYGYNRLPLPKKRAWYTRLGGHINNALIYIMLVASALTFLLGHHVDAFVIFLVIVVNTLIGYVQEGRAEKALEAIRGMMAPHASVLRDGKRAGVEADAIVPGDIVLLEAGDRIPVDLRLLHTRFLKIDEAALTGESVPVEKEAIAVPEQTPLAEQSDMAFSGTFVTSGQGLGVTVRTGAATELGRINEMLSDVMLLKTPLLQQMDTLAKRLTFIILGVAALLFVFAYYVRNYELVDAFMTVVGFAVAVVPEGLPAVMTIALAIGVHRMAQRKAIIRRLPAVETLGAVSVICSDKTGTLTCNEMTVRQLVTADFSVVVNGTGYAPNGTFEKDGFHMDPSSNEHTMEICQAALLCNDASLRQNGNSWQVNGDPMEGALVTLALKAGYDQDNSRKEVPRLDEIPFDAAHRFMATLHHDHEMARAFMVVKGAPEQILTMCDKARSMSGDRLIDIDFWTNQMEMLAAQGERVLALAVRDMPQGTMGLTFDDAMSGLTLLGFVGLIDPPRSEAIAAVRECRNAGIRVVMITGDHAATALAIARQLGLADNPKALTGKDLDSMSTEELQLTAREITVFARANPEHKLRLIRALQEDGAIIAMTGDGVNDAPALKQANVGVAMGNKGTEVAKEASEMVLADDNFASIAAAVREGRTVYDNLQKVIAWTLPTNVGEVLAIIVAVMFGLAMPLTPVQILWINMVTSVALGLVLAFEPTEPGTMQRPPRRIGDSIITPFMLWRIVFVSTMFMCATFGIYYHALSKGLPIEAAHTLVVNVIVVLEIFYLFSVRYVHGTSLTLRGVIGTPPVLIGVIVITAAQLFLTYMPLLQNAFGTHSVKLEDGILVILIGIVFLLIIECEKRIRQIYLGRQVENFLKTVKSTE